MFDQIFGQILGQVLGQVFGDHKIHVTENIVLQFDWDGTIIALLQFYSDRKIQFHRSIGSEKRRENP